VTARRSIALAAAALTALALAACEAETGTEDTSPGPPDAVPGAPGVTGDDMPEDQGLDDL
jgi:hypothetical protein